MVYKLVITFLLLPVLVFGQIPQDKQKHFLVGYGIGAGTYALTYSISHNKTKAVVVSTISSFAIGTIKEIVDMQKSNNFFDPGDLVMTGMGGIVFNVSIDLISNKKPRRFRRGFIR